MKKRALAAALCLMLVFALLPKTALAEESDTLYFKNGNLKFADSSSNYPGEDDTWSGNGNTLTLLGNFNFTTSAEIALDLQPGTTLVLHGENSVTSTCKSQIAVTCGIKCTGELTIQGDGMLTATGGGSPSDHTNTSYGVWVDGPSSIAVESGNITGIGGETNGGKSCGVHATGITASGGSITGTGGKTSGDSGNRESYGVYSNVSIVVNGGSIAGTGGETAVNSYGVYSEISISVDSGSITGTGGAATNSDGNSYGVYSNSNGSNESITVNGGSITGTGGRADDTSFGVYTNKNITITVNGGSIAGTGGAAHTSYGVYADSDITANGGSITGTGGETTGGNSYGVYSKNSITVDSGSITGTGGAAGDNSYGVHATGITASGGSITGTGGTARTQSCGISANASGIQLTGGRLVGKSTAGKALDMEPSLPAVYFWRTGESALYTASASASLPDGFNNGIYADIRTGLPITFTKQPIDTTVTEGSTGSLEAGVSAPPSGTATLNWYACDAGGTISGGLLGTGGTFTIPSTLTAGTHYYLCQAEYQEVKIINSRVATVTVTPAPTVTSVTVSPATEDVVKGGSTTFTANVEGTNDPAQTVTWSVTGGVTGTGIDANGVLTVAANETATTLTVKATSTVNNTMSGTAAVTVTTSYEITQGQNGKYSRDSSVGLSFTANGDYSKFTNGGSVSVDGAELSSSNYSSRSGSTIVTLNAAYLETLAAGQHTLRISFSDGYTETRFTILARAAVPATGDSAQPMLWLSIALLACAGLAVSVVSRRKRQNG